MSGYEFEPLPLSAFGDLRVINLSPIFQYSFEYTVSNTDLILNTLTNGGTVTQASAMAVVSSSATTASTALLQSVRHAKYMAGLGALLRFSLLLTTGATGTEQYAGITDEVGSSAAFKNGLAVGFDGATFGFHRFVNDTKVTVNQSAFNGDTLDGNGSSGMTIDHTKLNVWQIRYQYLGAGEIELCVENPATGNFITVHTIQFANSSITPSSFNPNYRFMMFVNNKATTTDIFAKCASCAYFIEGDVEFKELQRPQFGSGERQKTAVTAEVAICTIKNKTTYASKTNFIDALVENIGLSIEASSANNLGKIRLVRNATLGGTPVFNDINTTDSIMSIDTAGTTVTGGKELFTVPLAGKNDRESLNLIEYKIMLLAGDTITVAGSSSNSATINTSLLWKELF